MARRGLRAGLHFPQCSGAGAEAPEAAGAAGSGASAGSGAAAGATMAETDPKSVQDLTAVVRDRAPGGLGTGCRGLAEGGEEGKVFPGWGLEQPGARGASLPVAGGGRRWSLHPKPFHGTQKSVPV